MGNAILIIEDEQNIADLIKDRLDDEGYQSRIAYSGAEAFAQLKAGSPDVITLDIYLPDANGLAILKELRADPKTNKIPVIIISSSDEVKNPEEVGAQGMLKKPIDFKKLFAVIKSIKS